MNNSGLRVHIHDKYFIPYKPDLSLMYKDYKKKLNSFRCDTLDFPNNLKSFYFYTI